MKKPSFEKFSQYVLDNTHTIAQRTIAFLYFRVMFIGGKATVKELVSDFVTAGQGPPQQSVIRDILLRDPRTKKVSVDAWIIPTDRIRIIEQDLNLDKCFKSIKPTITVKGHGGGSRVRGVFIDHQRIKELRRVASKKYDLARLVRMCIEINDNFPNKNYISVIILVRTIMNHVAPILGFKSFAEVANNYKCERSIKNSLRHLEDSSRQIADSYLHIPARKKEILPTITQVNFSQDLDVLLGEIVRVLN
jgi:hypothetical protein